MTLLNKARQNRISALENLAKRDRNLFVDIDPARPEAKPMFLARRAALKAA